MARAGAKFGKTQPVRPRRGGFIPAKPGRSGRGALDLSPVAVGWARIVNVANGDAVECRMGEDAPQVLPDGYGGWETVQRPRRRSLTIWRGSEPERMTVSFLLDGFAANRSVEAEIDKLERMGRAPDGNAPPPKVRVVLPGGKPRSAEVDWVIESPEWADALRGPGGRARTRQAVTIGFLEYVADEHLEDLAPSKAYVRAKSNAAARRAAKEAAKRSEPGKKHTVRKGETLRTIAAKEYGKAEKWKRIADANGGIRDPAAIKPGQVLKIP